MKFTTRIGVALLAAGALGACDVDQTEEGDMPDVDVEGGNMPEYDVEAADVDVGTEREDVTVPDVDVDTEERQMQVPDVDVDMPDDEPESR